jgi:hypothetical protein
MARSDLSLKRNPRHRSAIRTRSSRPRFSVEIIPGMSEEHEPDCLSGPSTVLMVVIGVLSLASVMAYYVYAFRFVRWMMCA